MDKQTETLGNFHVELTKVLTKTEEYKEIKDIVHKTASSVSELTNIVKKLEELVKNNAERKQDMLKVQSELITNFEVTKTEMKDKMNEKEKEVEILTSSIKEISSRVGYLEHFRWASIGGYFTLTTLVALKSIFDYFYIYGTHITH